METTKKRRRWPLVVVLVVVLLGTGVGVTIAKGGFEQVSFVYQPAEIGQALDLGPWEVTIQRAWIEASGLDPGKSNVTVQALCRNLTGQAETSARFVGASLYFRDPIERNIAGRMSLEVFPWDGQQYPSESLNPVDAAVQCQIRGTFAEGFSESKTLDVIAMPVVEADGLWDAIASASWVFATNHPYVVEVTLPS